MKTLNQVYNDYLNENIKKNKTFVISVLFHENIKSLMVYLMNVLYCFRNYNIYILISCNEYIYHFLCKTSLPKNIIIVTHRDDNMPMWGNVNLFDQHVKNYIYLKENNIIYDYFWFSASNDVFIKTIDDNLEDSIIKTPDKLNEISDDKINDFYDDFLINSTWMWYLKLIEDKNTIDTFIKNKIIIKCNEMEGLVLPYNLSEEVFKFYIENIYNKNTAKNYVMEEIYIPSYLFSKYNLNYTPFTIREKWCKYKELQNIYGLELIDKIKNYKNLYCIKTLKRDIEYPVRKYALNFLS